MFFFNKFLYDIESFRKYHKIIDVPYKYVAKAKGINETAQKANIQQDHLYEDLSTNSSPKFDTFRSCHLIKNLMN